ncbi:hypothetical protein [Agrobacterium tumefaciens]|uniref:hypothetical protein n=1 Tax=Agrobacterium tumefaciens TaxID=358 RepID=UPI001FA9E17C|nr:hypothetical protein [Agrobacterium tumefaciens]UNZ52983.1 hypothetical protein MLE07_19655 [Agrobacterium tumefaciens]
MLLPDIAVGYNGILHHSFKDGAYLRLGFLGRNRPFKSKLLRSRESPKNCKGINQCVGGSYPLKANTAANCFHFQVADVACWEVSRSLISENESETSVLSFELDERFI